MNPAYVTMIIAWLGVIVWVAFVILTNRKIHPKALFALFMVELWERFSYYGMRAILVLYMVSDIAKGGFAFNDAQAYGTYAAYGALVYLTPILGGIFADKMMGFRNAITWGALLMAAGQFTLFMDNQVTFYIGLALLVVGNGFFKPNISSMIGKFYKDGDSRRDGAFTIFYMGINIGAFLTPLTCGAIGEIEGWRYGFLTAGIGMMLGFLIFEYTKKKGWLETLVSKDHKEILETTRPVGLMPEEGKNGSTLGIPNKFFPFVITLIMVPLSWFLIKHDDIVDILLSLVAVGIIVYMLVLAGKYDKVQKQRIWVILILLFFTTIFWTFFELAGSALNLFTDRNIDKNIMGVQVTTTFFQSVNPLFIMIFAPLFSWLWIKLANSGKEPAAPYKFGVGLVLLGLGYLVLNLGNASQVAGMVPAMFLISLYLLHTLGELTLSPVGLSLVTKLAPSHIVGMLMGIWFLSSSIAHQGGKHIANMTAVNEKKIVQSESFQSCMSDWPEIRDGISDTTFLNKLGDKSLENTITSAEFVDYLNQYSSSINYYTGKIQVEEKKKKAERIKNKKAKSEALERSYVTFLTDDAQYADTNNIQVISFDDFEGIYDESYTGEVVQCLRQDSLHLGLRIFRILGFIAIGCGVLVFLLGPMVSRWMHGLK
jgi:proton-dependent oligopeptide transporter, POT family